MKVCDLSDVLCLHKHADDIRALAFPTDEMYADLLEAGIECMCPAGRLINFGDHFIDPL